MNIFFWGHDSLGMNRSAELTNRLRIALQFMHFVCLALQFIPYKPRKKDFNALIKI